MIIDVANKDSIYLNTFSRTCSVWKINQTECYFVFKKVLIRSSPFSSASSSLEKHLSWQNTKTVSRFEKSSANNNMIGNCCSWTLHDYTTENLVESVPYLLWHGLRDEECDRLGWVHFRGALDPADDADLIQWDIYKFVKSKFCSDRWSW